MTENREIYINKILNELKSLESDLLEVKNNNSLPFSFFKESFDKTQSISQLLHKLEFIQVDEMKVQMDRLVKALSETEIRAQEAVRDAELAVKAAENKAAEYKLPEHKAAEAAKVVEIEEENKEKEISEPSKLFPPSYQGNEYARSIDLPEYKKQTLTNHGHEVFTDEISSSKARLDLKRGISLNDRFLFQRELFNNNRAEINDTFEKLNTFESYEQAESYLKENKLWNFENPTVIDFLSIIQNGFK